MYRHRSAQRVQASLRAGVVVSDKEPSIYCTVRNLSDGGACLQTTTTAEIPSTFAIVIEGEKRACRVVWRTDSELGVTFHADAPAPIPARPNGST
jgi:hypothetical protein